MLMEVSPRMAQGVELAVDMPAVEVVEVEVLMIVIPAAPEGAVEVQALLRAVGGLRLTALRVVRVEMREARALVLHPMRLREAALRRVKVETAHVQRVM